MSGRTRARTVMCAMPNCPNAVRRSNAYRLCVNHLVGIWEFVGERYLPQAARESMYFEPATAQPPSDHVLTVEEQEARRLARRMSAIRSAKAQGTLYVLDTRDEDLVKIGWTSRPLGMRMAQYPPRYRVIITAPGTRADERDVHRSLKHARAAAREWYYIEPEVVRQINVWVAQANVRQRQETSKERERREAWTQESGLVHPNGLPEWTPLPKFESVEQWFSHPLNQEIRLESRPAPQSRSIAHWV